MICPRCSVAEISNDGLRCSLCGFTPSVATVTEPTAADEMMQAVQAHLAERYRLLDVVRVGEFSIVFRAMRTADETVLALKVIAPAEMESAVTERFAKQAVLAQGMSHPHLVRVRDSGVARSFLWYTMDLQEDGTLADLLRTGGFVEPARCLGILEQVASGLDYLHRNSVIHGDVKPTNIFVDDAGWIRLGDAAVMNAFVLPGDIGPRPGPLPEYMAPEQFFARHIGPAADQYSLGIVAYQCVTGTLPFVGDSFEEVAELQANASLSAPTGASGKIPVPFVAAMHRALSKHFGRRFPTVLDFVSALSGGRESGGIMVATAADVRVSGVEREVLWVDNPAYRRRRWWRWVVPIMLTLGAAAVVASVAGVFPASEAPPPQETAAPPAREVVPSAPPAAEQPLAERLQPDQPTPTPDQRPQDVASAPARPAPAPSEADPAGTDPPAAAPVADPARLFINARPWGTVYVDGEPIGPTPVVAHEIPPGIRVLRVVREGFVAFEQRVELAPGQELRLTDIVLQPRGP